MSNMCSRPGKECQIGPGSLARYERPGLAPQHSRLPCVSCRDRSCSGAESLCRTCAAGPARNVRSDRDHWPDMSDPAWRRSIHDYHVSPAVTVPVQERRVYVEHVQPARQGMSLMGAIAIIVLIIALGWFTFLVSTRGMDQAKQDIRSSFQSAAYA